MTKILCECGLNIVNIDRHLKAEIHKKMMWLRDNHKEFYEQMLKIRTNQPDYHAIMKRIERYYQKNKNLPRIILPIEE